MSDNVFLLGQEDEGIQKSEFLLATIVTANGTAGTATILIDGMTTANVKPYKALSSAWPLAAGDRVVVMKLSGTYLVLGKIGNDQAAEYEPAFNVLPVSKGGTGQSGVTLTTKASDIITAASGITISSASAYKWGKFVALTVSATASTASTAIQFNLGTLKQGWIPANSISGITYAQAKTYAIQNNGVIQVYGSRAINDFYFVTGQYLTS